MRVRVGVGVGEEVEVEVGVRVGVGDARLVDAQRAAREARAPTD